jgi:hypothetical protein
MSTRRNPWALGDIADSVVKLEKLGVRSQALTTIRDLLDTLGQIERSLTLIEREDANRAAAREASVKFHKQFSQD